MSIRTHLYYYAPHYTIALVVLLLLISVGVLVALDIAENKSWAEYQKKHNCVLVEYEEGGLAGFAFGTTVTSSGKVGVISAPIVTPDKEAWKCDDGVTYWR